MYLCVVCFFADLNPPAEALLRNINTTSCQLLVNKKQIREISLTKLFIFTSRDDATSSDVSSLDGSYILVNDCDDKVQYCQCTQDIGFEL